MSVAKSWVCADGSCVCHLPPPSQGSFDYRVPDYSKLFKAPFTTVTTKEPMTTFFTANPTVSLSLAPSMTEMVREFHTHFGVREDHKMDSISLVNLRYDLIAEEVAELEEALFEGKVPDKVEAADALGDIIYVAIGAALAWDIDIERVVAEIHRSNMTKDGGGTSGDGKIMKGPGYQEPDLSFVNGAK